MSTEIITPHDEQHWLSLRTQDITSTDAAALFGMSPYKTRFELWHEKKSGERAAFTENERMRWGNRLEAAIAETAAEQRGWSIRPFKEYLRLPDLRIGSSFDYRIAGSDVPFVDSGDDAILEIKNVDWLRFKQDWTVDGDWIEAADHIELQLQHQLLVSGLRRGYFAVLVGGNDLRIIERQADEQAHMAIRSEAAAFWQSIDENRPPEPVMPDDAAAVIRMHQFAEPGKLFDARGDAEIATLLREYRTAKAAAKDADESADVAKAALLQRIGDAEKVLADGFTISAGIVGAAEIAYTRQAYRNFRVTEKKAGAK